VDDPKIDEVVLCVRMRDRSTVFRPLTVKEQLHSSVDTLVTETLQRTPALDSEIERFLVLYEEAIDRRSRNTHTGVEIDAAVYYLLRKYQHYLPAFDDYFHKCLRQVGPIPDSYVNNILHNLLSHDDCRVFWRVLKDFHNFKDTSWLTSEEVQALPSGADIEVQWPGYKQTFALKLVRTAGALTACRPGDLDGCWVVGHLTNIGKGDDNVRVRIPDVVAG
jgi:hypothetical protein